MTVFGWDASDYDWARGSMDFASARAAGVAFFTHKATEGTSVRHKHYGEALNRARAAGVEFLGAYIVPRTPGPGVAAQVDYFLSYVDSATPWWCDYPGWFFQVDTEQWSYDKVSPAVGEHVCQLLRERTGRWVVHYAPRWAYGDSVPGTTPLWASDYGPNAARPLQAAYPGDNSTRWRAYSGRTPTFLQFGSQVTIGRQQFCDGNAFRGSVEDLRALITGTEENDMTPDESKRLVVTGERVRAALLDGESTTRDGGYNEDRPVWIVQAIKELQAAVAGLAVPSVDAAALAKALLADPGFKAALAQAAFEGAQRAERE